MKYVGRIKNRNEETIEVVIITNNSVSQTTELSLAGESPIIISQSSSDGIFSPIKSRSCTITIVSKEIYFDMYSGSSHGTSVTVNNLSQGECLFYGYLTPCEYNQPLLYLNEIELEAVDAVSTLQDFIYSPISNSGINPIKDLILNALHVVCSYDDIYIPKNGNKIYNSDYPTKIECLSDEMFKDDDKGYISWYDILESICSFYGLSLVPFGKSVYFIDYEILNHCANSEVNETNISNNFYTYVNIVLNSEIELENITKVLGIDSYSGEDQNIELDEVYNKISVKADVSEVDSDNLYVDPLKTVDKAGFMKVRHSTYTTWYYRRKKFLWWTTSEEEGSSTYNIYDRFFYYSYGWNMWTPRRPVNSYWQCWCNTNAYLDDGGFMYVAKLGDKFSHQYRTDSELNLLITNGSVDSIGSVISYFNYQFCTINQQFGWKEGGDMPLSVDWVPYIEFHTGIESWYRYYMNRAPGQDTNGSNVITVQSKLNQYGASNIWELWWNMYTKELMDKPVLEYNSDVVCNYTPINNDKINYICFTGDLLWQHKGNYGSQQDNSHKVWDIVRQSENPAAGYYNYHVDYTRPSGTSASYSNMKIPYMTFPIIDAGYSGGDEVLCYQRTPSDADYNKGWGSLKCILKIGDKYWNGTTWTTTESTFWINYHKENVSGGDNEKLAMYEWNKPVTNHNFNQGIGKDCWAIPIRYTDNVYGKMTFKIFTPYTHLYGVSDNQMNSKYMSIGNTNDYSDYIFDIHIENCIPVIFMKDLSLELVSANNYGEDGYSWISEVEPSDDDDDIVYSNNINTNNVLEFDDIDLKINTYNSKKPLSNSYLFTQRQNGYGYTSENFKDFVTDTTGIQERLLINKYESHYRQPKKIYNCQVHSYYNPYDVLLPTAIPDTKLVVDEQEYDVKADTNELKLIEY